MKKTKNEQAASTTRKLQHAQAFRIRSAIFFSCLFVLFLVAVGFCYITDSRVSGITNIITIWTAVGRSLELVLPERLALPTVFYTVTPPSGSAETIDISLQCYTLLVLMLVGMLWNSLVARLANANSRRQIQMQLQPLYNLAKAAKRLSDEERTLDAKPQSPYDPNRIHSLESAIDSIKPDSPDAKLRTDDADLKGLEAAINSLLLRARESSEQQIRFVSDASHELRTPIAVIKGYTDMLDRWGKDDETILEESISAIKTETEHMNRLVEQLLFLARGDSGRTRLKIEQFSLSDLVREVCEESIMIDPDHKWEISAEKEVLAYGDVALIKQAVRILSDNAKKYTPEGGTVVLRAHYENAVPTAVVQDTGIGISAEDMSHVFDRFYRSDPARVREKGGTGLGLSIAKWIIDRHDGYFEVLSSEDMGTRITIRLPARLVPNGDAQSS